MATYNGDSADNSYAGTTDPDTIAGNGGNDILHGGDGADIISGGAGVDQVYGEAGDDILDILNGEIEAGDLFDGGADTDTLRYMSMADIDLSGVTITGVERLISGASTAVISLTRAQLSGFTYIDAAVRITDMGYVTLAGVTLQNGTFYLSDFATYIDFGSANALVNLTVHGGLLNDTILGHNGLADTIYGGGGDDLIDGQGGNDLMYGGVGNDQYYVSSVGDQVFEDADEGVDTVYTNLASYTLGANFENLTFYGVSNTSGTGNSADNILTGSLGRNTLTGGAGRDEIHGDFGNDILVVAEGDYVAGEIYDGGDGTDILRYTGTSDVDFSGATITAVERLEVTTSATVGLTIAQLQGFNNVTGAVRLTDGGTLSVGGITFQSGSSLTLSDDGNNVDFTGSPTTAITVHGGDGIDSITGTAGSDTLYGGGNTDSLDGGAGGDIMAGGAGNDYYTVDNAGDQVYEAAGEGNDSVYTSTASYTLPDNVEGLVYIGSGYFTGVGNGLGNNIVGGDFGNNLDGRGGNDIIYGGAGADTLRGADGTDFVHGYAGNDIFQIAEGDVAMGDYFDGGADYDQITYLGAIDFDLSVATIVSVETLYVDWGTTVSLTVAQLEGFSNVDAVTRLTDGGAVDLSGITLAKGQMYLSQYGNSLDFSTLVNAAGIAMTVYGGAGADTVTGTDNNDTIYGGGGTDVLSGLGGDDIFIVSQGGNLTGASFDGGGGTDTLRYTGTFNIDLSGASLTDIERLEVTQSGVSVTLTRAQIESLGHIEGIVHIADGGTVSINNAYMTGSLLYLSDAGNTLDMSTTPNWAPSAVIGSDGNDTILGRTGGVEALYGYGGDDVLDGQGGADEMSGGIGNDTYFVDDAGDVVTEFADAGHDLINTSLSSYTLGANFEDLTYIGSGSFTGTGNDLDNVITGGADADTLTGAGGTDSLIGGAGDDTLIVSEGDLLDGASYDGGADNDTLRYTGTSDIDLSNAALTDIERLEITQPGVTVTLTRAQIESLGHIEGVVHIADGGAVSLNGTQLTAQDIYLSDDGNSIDLSSTPSNLPMTVHGGAGNDDILGHATVGDTLYGGAGNDVLNGQSGGDTMFGGADDDTYYVNENGDFVVEYADEGHDLINTSLSSYTLGLNFEDLTYTGVGSFNGTGNDDDNVITGGVNSDNLDGRAGADTLYGGDGADTLRGAEGLDSVYGEAGTDILYIAEGDVEAGDLFDGGADSDTLYYLGAIDLDLSLTTITDVEKLYADWGTTVTVNIAQLESFGVVDAQVRLADSGVVDVTGITFLKNIITLSDGGNSINLNDAAGTNGFTVHGGAWDDVIIGRDGASDTLYGNDGYDSLDGGAGDDVMAGGLGDDTYYVDSIGDQVIENADEGYDLVETTLTSYTLGANVDDLAYTGTANFTGTGNELGNYIDGDAGNDLLKGLDGDDVLSGWDGNDQLEGGAGADMLDGGDGDDTMIGGEGDDAYFVHDAGDVVVEAADEGFDGIFTDLDRYTLAANVEGLIYAGNGGFIGIGNELDNIVDASYALDDSTLKGMAGDDVLVGGLGNDRLNGGTGADYMEGGDGDDTYIVDDAGDLVVECGCTGSGTDTVLAAVDYTLTENVENLTLLNGAISGTGNELDNVLIGNGSHNILDGGEGADTMDGGSGDDTYFVDNELDVVIDSAGIDTVKASVSYALEAGVAIEILRTTDDAGTDAIDLTGNALVNILIGNAGDNVLDGGAGADRLEGLGGDDTYHVDNAADLVVEAANGGHDRVEATTGSYTLGANVEELVFTGSGAFFGWGNESSNLLDAGTSSGAVLRGMGGDDTLLGGTGNDKLDGGTGADVMIGGAGDDIYVVDDAGDDVQETGGGNDTVRSQVSYTLTAGVETLILTGGGSNSATGNALDNVIIGNGGHNLIDGGAGADQMDGGAGDDTYIVDNAGDVTIDTAGFDTVKANLNYGLALGYAIEVLRTWDDAGTDDISLVGNEFANRIIGNAGGNYLNGGAGNDRLEGLSGDDRLDGGNDNDVLIGGDGADTFAFASHLGATNVDTIVDFVHGVDKIELDAAIFHELTGTSLSAEAFALGTSATTADQRILYDKATGNLWYDADGSGSGAAVKFATLQNHPANLSASDFVVTGSFGSSSLVLDIDDFAIQLDAVETQGDDAPSPDFAPEMSAPHTHWMLSGDDGLVYGGI